MREIRRIKAHLGISILILTISISAGGREGQKSTSLSHLAPFEIQGWKAKGNDARYNRQTIFDYLNGAGEIYRWYGFQELVVRQFAKADQPDVVLEMFDMGSSEDAFGIFSHMRDGQGEAVGIGQCSEYNGGQLFFWQEGFYINIYALREIPLVRKAVLDLGRTISLAIGDKGEKPKLLDYLPTQGLLEQSIRYFHNHLSLNRYYSLGSENILHLDHQTKAVLAKYLQNGAQTSLLLVQYQTLKKARAIFERFVGAYMPEAKQSGYTQRENGRWSAAKKENVFIIAIFDAPTKVHAEALMSAVTDLIADLGFQISE